MWHGAAEVIDGTAEAVADVDAVGLPAQPVERGVVAAQVCAEGKRAALRLRVVRVVDAHKCSAQPKRGFIHNLDRR